jgi:hypothetical protein
MKTIRYYAKVDLFISLLLQFCCTHRDIIKPCIILKVDKVKTQKSLKNLVLVTKTEGMLGLINDTSTGTTMDGFILAATHLVSGGLASGLLVVRNDTTVEDC